MIKRSTWIVLAILALVIGAYFLIKTHPLNSAQPTPTITPTSFLITQSDGVLQSLHISDNQGNTVQMQRDLSKTWVITAPTTGPADQGLAGAAETQVGSLSVLTTLTSPPDLASMGLDKPADVMELTFANGTSHKVEIGNLTPTGSGYFIRFDDQTIHVVSKSGIDALLNLLKAPPYPATATPEPTSTPTITPTPQITSPAP